MSSENPGDKTESLLIQRIREGEEYAFEIAFLKYYTPLCKFTWKYVQSEALAKEIVQEVFADTWENRSELLPSGHLRGYLYEVTRNKALDYIKHQKIVDEYITEAKKRKKTKYYQNQFRKESDFKEFRNAVKESIEDLPPRGRQIFKLNRNEGLTYKEISEFLDISIKTVETHMRRVLKKLRDHLSDYVSPFIIFGIVYAVSNII